MFDTLALWTARLFETVAVILLAVMSVFVMLSSFMRYIVGAPFAFTEDFVGLLFCAIIFLVLPSVQWSNRHITVDLFSASADTALGKAQLFGRTALTLLFTIWFGVEAFDFAYYAFKNKSATLVGSLPIYPWVGVIVVSVAIMGFIALKQFFHGFPYSRNDRLDSDLD